MIGRVFQFPEQAIIVRQLNLLQTMSQVNSKIKLNYVCHNYSSTTNSGRQLYNFNLSYISIYGIWNITCCLLQVVLKLIGCGYETLILYKITLSQKKMQLQFRKRNLKGNGFGLAQILKNGINGTKNVVKVVVEDISDRLKPSSLYHPQAYLFACS